MADDILSCAEWVACNLCGSRLTQPFAQRGQEQVVRCARCSLVYVNPRPDAVTRDACYNTDADTRLRERLAAEDADRRTADEILAIAERVCPLRGDLLDVGTGIGTSLALARERGWRGHGVEIDRTAARFCRDHRQLKVTGAALERMGHAARSFDVILLGHVLEQMPYPAEAMQTVSHLLRPGGCALITTPNVAALGGRWRHIRPAERLYYFAPNTLHALVTRAGLSVETLGSQDRYRALGGLVVRLPLRANLMVVARKPAQTMARAA